MPNAYVLRRVPIEGSTIRLECWSWGYDGQSLLRRDKLLTLDMASYDEIRIEKLAVYPSRFASQTTLDQISAIGKKF